VHSLLPAMLMMDPNVRELLVPLLLQESNAILNMGGIMVVAQFGNVLMADRFTVSFLFLSTQVSKLKECKLMFIN